MTVAWNLIYPVGDILLLILTLGAAALVPAGRRTRWYLMAAASLVNAIGDVCALFDNGIGATHFGYFWNSIAWPASLFLFSLSVWVGSPRPAEDELKETSSGFVIPGVAAGLALLILFVGSLDHINQIALGLATATLVAAGARFGLALLRLRALTDERHRQLADSAKTRARLARGAPGRGPRLLGVRGQGRRRRPAGDGQRRRQRATCAV